jgi:hypothetical protein
MLLWDWVKPVLPPVGLCFATKSSQEVFLRRNDRLFRQLQLLCYTQRPHPYAKWAGSTVIFKDKRFYRYNRFGTVRLEDANKDSYGNPINRQATQNAISSPSPTQTGWVGGTTISLP